MYLLRFNYDSITIQFLKHYTSKIYINKHLQINNRGHMSLQCSFLLRFVNSSICSTFHTLIPFCEATNSMMRNVQCCLHSFSPSYSQLLGNSAHSHIVWNFLFVIFLVYFQSCFHGCGMFFFFCFCFMFFVVSFCCVSQSVVVHPAKIFLFSIL